MPRSIGAAPPPPPHTPKWQRRRFRHLRTEYGVKNTAVAEELQRTIVDNSVFVGSNDTIHAHTTPVERLPSLDAALACDGRRSIRSVLNTSSVRSTPRLTPLERRDSVARIAYDTISAFVQSHSFHSPTQPRAEVASAAETTTPTTPIGFRSALIDKECGGTTSAEHDGTATTTIGRLRAIAASASRRIDENPTLWTRFWRRVERGSSYKRPRPTALPIFGQFRRRKCCDPYIARQLDDVALDYRPFFTYWITTVQVCVTLFAILLHGVGTDFTTLDVSERSGDVMGATMSTLHIVVWEQNNIWIGPRYADLVHLGAKYSPCMRSDPRITDQIAEERRMEATSTGCCIGTDGRCYQTSLCSRQFANFKRWTRSTSGRLQPAVCGQDPRYCADENAHEWGIDLKKWPICDKPMLDAIPRLETHMHCQVEARPCCIQMHGQCRITTREYCTFVNGYYHENATLCAQVFCLNDVCGMTPFLIAGVPDQFYRFVLPLFIHAGIIRIAITCALQLTVMRSFERMIGSTRLGIIYFVAGVGGYLASASFVPYSPEVGPAGSQGGVLGALIINVIYNWRYLKRPGRALFLHLITALFFFVTGLLPWIDNWAQVFGFLFGILMAAALIPYFDFGRGRRLLIVAGSLGATSLLFVFLLLLFYGLPVFDSQVLSLLNCPLIGSRLCDQQGWSKISHYYAHDKHSISP